MSTGKRQFVNFVLVGGFAALVNIALRVLFDLVLPYEVAIVFAYLIAMVTAYALSRVFVFEASGRGVRSELTRFALVNVAALAQVWLISVLLFHYGLPALGWTWRPELVAHTVGVVSPVIVSYLGHRYFSFRRADEP